MKANELMLGDWIIHDGKPEKVDVIWSAKQVSLYDPSKDWGSIYTDKHSTDDIKPVPLTADVLEKNGFIFDEYSPYYLPINEGSVRFSEHQYGWYCNILCSYQKYDGICNYVHQLQHALRLCGIEKTIEL